MKESERLRQSIRSTSKLKTKVEISYQEYYVEIRVIKSRSKSYLNVNIRNKIQYNETHLHLSNQISHYIRRCYLVQSTRNRNRL